MTTRLMQCVNLIICLVTYCFLHPLARSVGGVLLVAHRTSPGTPEATPETEANALTSQLYRQLFTATPLNPNGRLAAFGVREDQQLH